MSTLTNRLRTAIALAGALAFAGVSTAQERPTYSAHWGVGTSEAEMRWRAAPDWAAMVDFGDAPIRRDLVVLYEQHFLEDVRTQGVQITKNPQWWTEYEARLRALVERKVPDPNFSGYVCLDVEFLDLFWGDRTAGPGLSMVSSHSRFQFDRWYDYIRTTRPQLLIGTEAQREARLKQGYELAVKDVFLRTVEITKSVRPGAKVGYYGFPYRRNSEYSRHDAAIYRGYNDYLSWFYEAQDVLFPSLYQTYVMVDDSQTPNWGRTWRRRDLETLMRSNIEESRRIAGERPVLVFTMVKFCELAPGDLIDQCLPDDLMDLALLSPKRYGADGVVIWDYLTNVEEYNRLQQRMTDKVNPRLAAALTPLAQVNPSAPPGQPIVNAGSGNSGGAAAAGPGRRSLRGGQQASGGSRGGYRVMQNNQGGGSQPPPGSPGTDNAGGSTPPTPATPPAPSAGGGNSGSGSAGAPTRRISSNWRNLIRRQGPYKVVRVIDPRERLRQRAEVHATGSDE